MIHLKHSEMPFGIGGLASPYSVEGRLYTELGVHDQARVLGWLSGCPVVEELTEPNNPNPGRGPEAMVSRYDQINGAFFNIFKTVYHRNPQLGEMLNIPVARHENEPVGDYEQTSVPEEYDVQMAPMGTLVGYSLPRLFLKEVDSGSLKIPTAGFGSTERELRHSSATSLVDIAAGNSDTPLALLANFAELIATHGHISTPEILKSVLPSGWYDEHKADGMLEDAKRQLEVHAPSLWGAYRKMTAEDKQKLGII